MENFDDDFIIDFNSDEKLKKPKKISKEEELEAKIKELEAKLKKEKETKKKITIKGKEIKYNDENDLAKKLKVDVNDIDKLLHTKYILNKKTGEFDKFSIQDKPLILKDFGIKTIQNKKLATEETTVKRNKQNIIIKNNIIEWGIPMTFNISFVAIKIWMSTGNRWERKLFLNVQKQILNNEDELGEYLLRSSFGELATNPFFIYIDNNRNFSVKMGDVQYYIKNIKIFGKHNTQFDITEMGLRDVKPLKISMFNETISEHKNCVKDLLIKKYPKISKKTIESIGEDDGINCNQIKNFCSKYNIKMIAYDINKNVISEHRPSKINKSYPSLIFTAYNNHIYELDNDYLKKEKINKVEKYEYVQDIKTKLINILKNGRLPDNINIFGSEITYFYLDNVCYHSNSDFEKIKTILTSYGLIDKLDVSLTLSNVSDIIEQLYIKENLNSLFPYEANNNGGYVFLNEKIKTIINLMTIDQNKHYSYILRNLKYLLQCDIKHAKHTIKPLEITPYNIYIAKPIKSTILMPSIDYYTGEFLIYCKNEGLEFELLEGIECNVIKTNYYSQMIDDLYNKVDIDTFKDIIVRMIGRFNGKPLGTQQHTKFLKIANKDETNCTPNAEYIELDDTYNLMFTINESINNIYSKKPIRMQIIEGSRRSVYEKMKELKLKDEDVKQIKTDAITFINKNNVKIINDNSFGGWKIQEETKYFENDCDYINNDISFKLKPINDDNEIYLDYAGSGKTHHIINNILPNLNDYIVLTPSHASLKEYRLKKLNSSVIQAYTLKNKLPSEKIIIVDEIGMCNSRANDLLLKCALLGKKIYSFGDFKQLKPVNDMKCDSPIFIDLLYKNIKSLGTNYRNDFSFEYYDYLLSEKDYKKLYAEIDKYNCKSFDKAEIIICYTNDLRNGNDEKKIIGYNQMMLDKLNLKWGDINTSICCKSNDLRDKDIYNNFYYTITNKKDKDITIFDGVEEKTITEDELNKYFCGGYCRTLYNIQGESVKSFYYPPKEYQYLDNEAVYTLISRLKTK